MRRFLLCLVLSFCTTAVHAETAASPDSPPTKCLLGGKSFSPGATIRASAKVNVCNADGTWGTTEQLASGCFFADAFYSVGATAAVTGNKAMTEVCTPDGTWSALPATSGG